MTIKRRSVDTRAPSSMFLSGLTSDQGNVVAKAAERQTYRANSVIVNGGDRATHFFLLQKGKIKYYRITRTGDEVLLWWVKPGDVFGLGTLVSPPTPYLGTAEAIDDCELLVWSGKKIRQLATTNRILAENAIRIVLHYLTESSDRLVGVVSETAEHRLARILLRLANETGQVHSDGVEFAMTNEHLASLADVSPFTASRQLKQWERKGAIQKTRGKILIHSPESLWVD